MVIQRRKKGQLSADRINRLNSIGFIWDPIAERWNTAFLALQKFYHREGHCRINRKLELDGLKLGVWVGTQRRKRADLTPERVKRLNSLGFIWKT